MTIARSASLIAVAIAALLLFAGDASAQLTKTRFNAKLLKQATVTPDQARETAQAAVAGDIEEEELEKEHGKLVFSFDIRNAKGTITEVQVDAKTGAVVATEEESKADEEKERRQEQKKNHDRKPTGKS
jgi:hypothetical protein